MNLFVFWKNAHGKEELITAPLDGTILPGVTRDSILTLARTWREFEVSERSYTMQEIVDASSEGRLIEAFGAGTAAIVSPIDAIAFHGKELAVPCGPDGKAGLLAKRLFHSLSDIQSGFSVASSSSPSCSTGKEGCGSLALRFSILCCSCCARFCASI